MTLGSTLHALYMWNDHEINVILEVENGIRLCDDGKTQLTFSGSCGAARMTRITVVSIRSVESRKHMIKLCGVLQKNQAFSDDSMSSAAFASPEAANCHRYRISRRHYLLIA